MSRVAFAALFTVLGSWLLGCGGGGAPHVDPRPIHDGGISDRDIFEAGTGTTDGAKGDAGDGASNDDGSGSTDGSATDASTDASVIATSMSLNVTEPGENDLLVARARFTPKVVITLTMDATATDQVKTVTAELWSTGSTAAKLSTTMLGLLGTNETPTGAGDAGTGAGIDAGSGAGIDGGTTRSLLVTYGDTPVDLSALTSATYELRTTAISVGGVTAMAKRTFRADAGPVIRVLSPKVDQAVRGSVFVSAEVIDPFHSAAPTVTATVAGIAVAPLTITGNLYEATVADTISTPALSGAQLLEIRATNSAGVAATAVAVRFSFDDVGPTITNTKPSTGNLIGGIVKLEAEVTDPAGVDAKTVVAVVAHGGVELEVPLVQDASNPKLFAHLFDTRRLSNNVLYPTLSFRASDVPGNQSAVGYPVAVDNTPPLADLDPPPDLRARRYINRVWRCSWEFDPLGDDAVSEGDVVRQLFDVRARVEDQGNTPAGGGADITPIARLDAAHVEMLALDDTDRALVVDSDNDGMCDRVNPQLVPTTAPKTSLEALLVNLVAVKPVGAADFTPDPSVVSSMLSDCDPGTETQPPDALCRTTNLTIAIPATLGGEPAVWAIPPVVSSSLQCVGNQLDTLGNHISDGPACLAVRAIDQLGNAQVSRVLHVCIDHDGTGGECPAIAAQMTGGAPAYIDTATPHGLATGARVLVGGARTLYEANGVWKVTVEGPQRLRLDDANVRSGDESVHVMPWTARSDCTGRQTSLEPVVVDSTTSCRPWRNYPRPQHLDIP